MSNKTKEKGDAYSASDASGVKVGQVFADLKETLAKTDPQQLAKTPETDTALDKVNDTERLVKEDNPEVYHDNICDPADIHILPSDEHHKAHTGDEQDGRISAEEQHTRISGIDSLRNQNSVKGEKENDDISGLSENFILSGHSYL